MENYLMQQQARVHSLVLLLLLMLALPGSGLAGDAAADFDLPLVGGTVDKIAPSTAGLNLILGVLGLPGTASQPDSPPGSQQAWQAQYNRSGPAQFYPDSSNGNSTPFVWDSGKIAERLLDQALSVSSGYVSSWAEGWLKGYGNARISFRISSRGKVSGSGDFLLPLYDSQATTVFAQFGLRTMTGSRVIGNLGLGQRFFLSENLALGYNTFLDQDFSRKHTRFGAGVEAWYGWLRLSANYYLPLSGWKESKDFEGSLVEERPAKGFDARLTGYLPFYPNLAVTGAFEQWKGERVASLGSSDILKTDPRVWSCGLVWTPVPAVAVSLNQRFSGGEKETQVGLTFNYRFGMPWQDQFSSAVVADMRAVDASRHDFVDRQYEMILAYQAVDGAYNIILLRAAGDNVFEFQITNGFGEPVAGQNVTVTAQGTGGTVGVSQNGVFRTDQNGIIRVELSPEAGVTQASVTVNAGDSSRTFDSLIVTPPSPPGYSFTADPDTILLNTPTDVTFTFLYGETSVGNGISVTFEANPGLNLESITLNTDANGQITLTLTATATGNYTVTVIINGDTLTYTTTVSAGYEVSFEAVITPEGDFVTGTTANDFKSTASLTAVVTLNGVPQTVNSGEVGNVYWSLDQSKNRNINPAAAAWWKRTGFNTYGLAWNDSGPSAPATDNMGTAPSGSTANLTDIVGSRSVTVTAGVCIAGSGASDQTACEGNGGTWYSEDLTVTFGNGPLSVFAIVPDASNIMQWATKGGNPEVTGQSDFTAEDTEFPAIEYVGGARPNNTGFTFGGTSGARTAQFPDTGWTEMARYGTSNYQVYYSNGCLLPTREQLQAVAQNTGKGAALAAGWPASGSLNDSNYWYWTGEVYFTINGAFYSILVTVDSGSLNGLALTNQTIVNTAGVSNED